MPTIDQTQGAKTWRIRHKGACHREPDEALAYLRAALMIDPEAISRFKKLHKGAAGTGKRHPKTKLPEPPLLSHEQVDQALRLCAQLGPSPYWAVRLMLTYGHRPITIARLTCDDLLAGGDLRVRVKDHRGGWREHIHPLFDADQEGIRMLIGKRPADAPLLLNSFGKGWSVRFDEREGCDRSDGLRRWYAKCIGPAIEPATGYGMRGVYRLKDRAITSMLMGWHPWRSKLEDWQVTGYTGHLSPQILWRYKKWRREMLREQMNGPVAPPAPFPPGPVLSAA